MGSFWVGWFVGWVDILVLEHYRTCRRNGRALLLASYTRRGGLGDCVITVKSAVLFPINRRRLVAGHVVYFLRLACFFYQVRSNGHLHACIKARLSLAVARACLFVRTVPFFFFLPRWHLGRLL